MPTKAKASKDTVVTGRIRGDIYRRLDALASATDRSRSFLVAEAIESYVSLQEWQVAGIKKAIKSLDEGRSVPHAQVMALFDKYRAKR